MRPNSRSNSKKNAMDLINQISIQTNAKKIILTEKKNMPLNQGLSNKNKAVYNSTATLKCTLQKKSLAIDDQKPKQQKRFSLACNIPNTNTNKESSTRFAKNLDLILQKPQQKKLIN